MEDNKESTLDSMRVEIVEKLDPTDNVLQYLHDKNIITDVVFSRISDTPIRAEQSRQLVDEVRRKGLFDEFIEALEYKNSHRNLAKKLSSCSVTRCKDPGKVDIMCGKMKTLSWLTVELHWLCNDGDLEAFDSKLACLKAKYSGDPDFMFRLLDEQASKQGMLKQGMTEPLDDMEGLIAHSDNSEVAAMAFLTRKGVSYMGENNLEQALDFLEKAKGKSLQMQPCFETGRVMYSYVHALMDVYERNPCFLNKEYLISNIKETIEIHFSNSEPEMIDSFTRIFYLKLAFCYLGINFKGRLMLKEISQEDWKAAEFYIKKSESMSCPFNKRRYMFLQIAKAVLLYRSETPNIRRALKLAKEAQCLSALYGFKKESPYIERFIDKLHDKLKTSAQFGEEMDLDIGHDGNEMETE